MSPVITSYTPADRNVYTRYCPETRRSYTTLVHRYRSGSDIDGMVIEVTVPVGEPTDFASIPWFLRWLFERLGLWAFAALIHDMLYRKQICTRAQADSIFLAIMADFGVGWWTRHALWLAVRVFGGYFWRKQAKRNAEQAGKD